jgi:cytochrome c553
MKNRFLSILMVLSLALVMNACDDDDPMAPEATATPAAQAINSGTATSVALTSDIQGTTFSWTVVQSGVTGATDGSGSTIAQTLTVTGLVTGTATYTVIPTSNGLAGDAINVVITVTPLKTTYNADVKSIFVTSCTPCHLAGGANNNKWDQYAQAKAKINVILDRVQRDPGASGFMPKGGTKLSAEKIAVLKKWLDDGLLEN